MSSTRLNPRLARLAFKLQHWMVDIRYLPGVDNTLADALSREERPPEGGQRIHQRTSPDRDVHLAGGDVEETPPQ